MVFSRPSWEVGATDGTVEFKPLGDLVGHGGWIQCVTFAPQGNMVYTADSWGKLAASTPKFVVESDATICVPLIFAWVLGR